MEITLGFGVDEAEVPALWVHNPMAGSRLLTIRVGQPIRGLPGLRGDLTLALFLVLRALARRRRFGVGDAMVSAEELQLDVRDLSAARIREVLSDSLHNDAHDDREKSSLPASVVVFRAPRSTQQRGRPSGGRSRGPYRMELPPASISFTPDARSQHEVLGPAGPAVDASCALEFARSAGAASNFLAAREILVRALGNELSMRSPAERSIAARLWCELSYIEMELGRSLLSLQAARRAEGLVGRDMRDCQSLLAHARLLAAHAHGQLQTVTMARKAAIAAFNAAGLSTRSGHLRRTRDPRKIELIGVCGQYLSRDGHHDEATRYLEVALDAATAAGSERWTQTWLGRLAENALNAGRPADAEPWIARLGSVAPSLPVTASAFLTRVTARHFTATGQWDDAARSATRAYELGFKRSMRYQVALLDQLRAQAPELDERLEATLPTASARPQ